MEAQQADNGTANVEAAQTPQMKIAELEMLGKVKLGGKEWSVEDLKKSTMMHSDYTKKTQALAEEKKFTDNLSIDVKNVVNNPELVGKFKEIYPEKYHEIVDNILKYVGAKEQGKDTDKLGIPKELLSRLEKIEGYVNEKEVSAIEHQLDTKFSGLRTKYEFAQEDAVLAKAQILGQRGVSVDDKVWDKLWKESNDTVLAKYEKYAQGKLNQVKTSHKNGQDTGKGGGVPGQAPRKLSFNESTELAIKELAGR